jgi:ADP-ribose pyrophosphatase YjhB (NUDIX family)
MTLAPRRCRRCGAPVEFHRGPAATVDLIIELATEDGAPALVLIERRYPPEGWALPGGFIDAGESAEQAAVREAGEETGLAVELTGLFGVYSEPGRDPRGPTLAVVYRARAAGRPRAGDDAKNVRVVARSALPEHLAFDHRRILDDYLRERSK